MSSGGNKSAAAVIARLLKNRLILGIAGVVVVAAVVGAMLLRGPRGIQPGTTFIAKRGNLDITVTEGGSVQALESQEIVSEIKGREGVKILSIVEEGYRVTADDVKNGLVLVELDSAQLEDDVVNQEISFQSAEAAYVEKKAQYEIQVNQNQSNITTAELTAKFALMDFEKYLGKKAVNSIIARLGLDAVAAELQQLKRAGLAKPEPPAPTVTLPSPAAGVSPESESPGRRQWNEGGRPGGGDPGAGGGDRSRRTSAGEGTRGGFPGGGGGRGGFGGGGPGGGGGMDPERFKAMIDANGGKIPEPMAERMREMGIDPDDVLRQMESMSSGGAPATPPQQQVSSMEPKRQMESTAVFVRDEAYASKRAAVDFASYAKVDQLEDGQAKQELRQFEDKILVAEQDLGLARTSLEGKERLAERQFITKNELDLERVKVQKAEIQLESAKIDLNLYVQYTFVKTAEKLISDYEEALMNLERTMQEAAAKLSQADAALKTAEQRYNIELNTLNDLKDQLSKCVIRAKRTGLVVYGSSTENNPFRRSNEEPIQEGTAVRERQRIITIPDMTKMGVKVNIHESAMQRVTQGQTVRLRVDAFPDRLLTGTVDRVAVLADSANMFMNPDLKVYPTTIRINDVYDWLRPGMSAEVEILVDTLTNVVYVPIQAVTYIGEDQYCYVNSNGVVERRKVTTGRYTEEFIEIVSGVSEGEQVLLLPPDAARRDKAREDDKDGSEGESGGDDEPAAEAGEAA